MIHFLAPVLISLAISQPGQYLPQPGETVLFLGDSNTAAGHFIADLDTYFSLTFPGKKNTTLINLGLPSETITGLSERDHPFPRPDVNERLDRALKATSPHRVVIGYGMNDGIYSPFDESRFSKYQQGYKALISKATALQARVTLLTPDPFEPRAVKGKSRPAGQPEYSYKNPFEDYDSVLAKYAAWQVSQQTNSLPVADAHTALWTALKSRRQSKPDFLFSGDGIHPSVSGHWFVAQEILRAWNAPMGRKKIAPKPQDFPAIIDMTGHLPYVPDSRWEDWVRESFMKTHGTHTLIIKDLDKGSYQLSRQGKTLGTFNESEFAKGIDLNQFPELPFNKLGAELRKLATERTHVLGAAMLTEVGHKRPSTAIGKPIAEARKIYDANTAKIQEILGTKVELKLEK